MTADDCSPKLIPVAEAARLGKTTALNILMQVKRGRLAGEEIDGAWYVAAAGLTALDEGPPAPGAADCQGRCGSCGGRR